MSIRAWAQLSVAEMRRAARHRIDYRVIAEHREAGDLHLNMVNISANGFMAEGVIPLGRGERLTLRLPVVGHIEAHLIWNAGHRAGFQFERLVRLDDYLKMIEILQPNPRLRRQR